MRFKTYQSKLLTLGLLTALLSFGLAGCPDDDDEPDAGNDTGMVEDTGTDTTDDAGMDADDGGDMADADDTGSDDTGMDADDGGTDATARLQVIHNAADPAASTVDVFVNGNLLIDDFEFRTATEYIDAPAETDLTIAVAGSDAGTAGSDTTLDDGETVIEEWSGVTLDADGTYIAIANGVANPDDFVDNPDGEEISVDLKLFDQAKEDSAADGSTDEVLVFHGATDAPTVDVVANNGDTPAVDDATYGDFQGYLPLPNGIHTLDITTADGSTRVASFQTPELAGGATYTIVASGFLTPADNQNGPALGLFAFPATAQDGNTVEGIELETAARLQVIHASPDPGAETVDVYVNDERLLDDFSFLTATPFVTVPSGVELSIDVAGPGSSDASNPDYTQAIPSLSAGSTTVAIASGVLDPDQFQGSDNGFMIRAGAAREMAETSGNVEFNIFHGSPDATAVLGGPVDAVVAGGGPTLADDLAFGSFSGIQSVAPMSYTLDVTTSDNATTAASFTADLSTLGDAYATVVAKGFVTTDDGDDPSDGEPFGLVAFTADGTKIDLPVVQ
jgi:hypothetical protein